MNLEYHKRTLHIAPPPGKKIWKTCPFFNCASEDNLMDWTIAKIVPIPDTFSAEALKVLCNICCFLIFPLSPTLLPTALFLLSKTFSNNFGLASLACFAQRNECNTTSCVERRKVGENCLKKSLWQQKQ